MNNPSRSALCRRIAGKAALALGVCIACGLAGSNASAQFVVIDPAHISTDVANFAKTIEQYAKDIAQYKAVLQHYQQQLVNLTHMNFSLPTMQNHYQEISDSDARQQVANACPSTDGGDPVSPVSGLLQIFTPSVNSPVLDNQRSICEQMQFRQIDKYNLTVKMMNRLQDYSNNLQSLQQQVEAGGTSEGALAGAKANMDMNATALENEMRTWNGQIMADDQMIIYMQNQQSVQAREILRGSNTVLGNVIQAGAFAAAFH